MAVLNERIKIARTMSGLSQDILAKNLGVMQSVVMRYEKERRPPDATLKKLAELTGFPMNWFWLEPVTGVLTFRPERPGVIYSPPQIRAKEKAIGRDWPLLLEALKLSQIVILQCPLGGIVIAYSDQVCVVVVGTHSIDTIQRVSVSLKLDGVSQTVKAVKEEDFLNCWMQPELLYLKRIIEYGGEALTAWASQIKEGKPSNFMIKYRLEADFFAHTLASVDENNDLNEKGMLLNIKNILAEEGIHLENATLKSTSAIVKGAPADWHFEERYGFPPKIPEGAIYTGPKDGEWPVKE